MAEEAAPKKKSKLLLFIILGVVLVLLIAGGVVGFLLVHSSSDDSGGDSAEAPAHQTKKKAKKKDEHPPIFEKLSQFTVNLNSPDQETMLQTDITVEVADAETEETLKNMLPKIQNEVNKLLRSKSPDYMRAPNSTDKLASEIRAAINKVLGVSSDDEGVLSVNFTTFIVQ
ncbi:flagellar FliL protein [Silvimonas terrae]|uniref:Flagellar protein FliL n=1 Tax=Silvimonas terrae TaxID=300266 RepID=A0A840RKE0_9NEIS|nr:flagellar basal body-associated FliL family protein [Silvimonas terrae]MBB5192940.1 flagellar FliL protein [Silvimonas terrae]